MKNFTRKGSGMGFKIHHMARVAKLLSLSVDESHELTKRMHGHLKKSGLNQDEIAKSFFVLNDIWKRKEEQKIKLSVPLLGFKNKGIEKYRIEIVKLKTEGLSADKIAKTLKNKKDAPSVSTIKRYIKALKEWRLNHG